MTKHDRELVPPRFFSRATRNTCGELAVKECWRSVPIAVPQRGPCALHIAVQVPHAGASSHGDV